MEGNDLLKLGLGERIVTLARLLAAEHVRQELESSTNSPNNPPGNPPREKAGHTPSLTQLAPPSAPRVEQHIYTPSLKSREAA